MKKVLICLLLFGVANSTGFAQGVERDIDIFPDQVSIEHNDAVKKFSKDYVSTDIFNSGFSSFVNSILQADQLAIINQIGNENAASIMQSGNNNYAMINIVGDENIIGIDQNGQFNLASFSIFGDENELSLLQQGNFNSFNRVYVTDGMQGQFTQSGFGLGLEIRGSNGIPISIEQTGQGSGILIENN